MPRHYIRKGVHQSQDAKGRFLPGHKFGKGRLGARCKKTIQREAREAAKAMVVSIEPTETRVHAALTGIIADHGGRDMLSDGEMQIARRAAWLISACEDIELARVQGADFDVTRYTRLVSQLTSTLSLLGLKRAPKDVTALAAYLEATRENEPEPIPTNEAGSE
jgi:hypothetical protein